MTAGNLERVVWRQHRWEPSFGAGFPVSGLGPTSRGGHTVVEEAVSAQFDPPHGGIVAPFRWMRPLRNDSEYPSLGRPVARADDVEAARIAAMGMVEWATELIDGMPDYGG